VTRQIPGKLGSSPDTSPAARPDVATAILSNLPPAPAQKATGPNLDGTDKDNLQPGLRKTISEAVRRVASTPVFGRPPAAAWHSDAVAAQTAQALLGTPTQAPVRKAGQKKDRLVYDSNGKPGYVDPDDLHASQKAGDVIWFYDSGSAGGRPGQFAGFANPKDVSLLETGRDLVRPTRPQPAPPEAPVPTREIAPPDPSDPVQAVKQLIENANPSGSYGPVGRTSSGVSPAFAGPPRFAKDRADALMQPLKVQKAGLPAFAILNTTPSLGGRGGVGVAFIVGLGENYLRRTVRKDLTFEPGDHGEVMRAGYAAWRRLAPENKRWVDGFLNSLPLADGQELDRQLEHYCRGSQRS